MKKPEINLNGWGTIKALSVKQKVSTQYISKLIRLNKIPFEKYPELNGLVLVPLNVLPPPPNL